MKLKHLLLIPLLLLTSCHKEVDTSSLNIIAPTGAPALCFYKEVLNSNFETNSKPKNIISMMTKESNKDIVIIDTVSGIKAINTGAPYLLASNITFGNFYIASTGNDEDNIISQDDVIVLFGEKQTPDYIFHYIYGNEFDSMIEYVASVQDAAKCLVSGKNLITDSKVDYVFIAEPALSKVLNNKNAPTYGKSSVYINIQDEDKKKSNNLSLVQASVFVKNTSDRKLVDAYLDNLKDDINLAISSPEVVKDSLNKLSNEEATSLFGINGDEAFQVISNNNAMGLGYIKAKENKGAIDKFISLFGMEQTNEEIYY